MQLTNSTLYLGRYAVPATPRAARNALAREVRSMSVATRAWYGLLSAGLAIGAVSALLALPPGWEVMGTSPSFEWGLLIVGYVFFAIMTSGLCLASSLGTVFGIERFLPFEKRHAVLAVLSLTTAFGIIALELHYPIRMVFGAVLVIAPSSPMWWMGVFYGAYLVVLLVEVWTLFTPHPIIHKYACTIAACIGVCAPTTLGAVFGVIGAKPFWNGIFTPILMVASAFVAGTALLGLVFWAVGRFRLAAWQNAGIALGSARILLAGGLIVVALLLARQIADGLTSHEVGFPAATLALVAGPLAPAFWGLRVMLGLVVPLAMLALPRFRTPSATAVTASLALLGVFVDRTLFVTAGEIVPRTTMAGTIGYPFAAYTPSPVEIGIIIGGVAFMAMAFSLCERYLDMGDGDVHVFWAWPWIKRHDDHAHDDEGAEAPAGPAEFPTPGAPDEVPAPAAPDGVAAAAEAMP
jgi:Ni/Fe-hydrogenase subunit HybB-like protein